jgi:molybdopterin/thiamine biosynthesis adenylyltransferase
MTKYFLTQDLIQEFEGRFSSKLFDNTILIIGLGGNGTHLALAAVRMGFRKIIGIDKDIVSESNLSRQVLYNVHDVGISNNLISNIETHNFDILVERQRFGNLVEEADLVFIVLDQPGASFFAIDTCYQLGKPAILGGTCVLSGLATRVSWMGSYQSPCLNCLLPMHESINPWTEFYKFSNAEKKSKSQEVSLVDKKLELDGGHPSIYPTACIGSNLMMSLAINYFMGRKDAPRMLEMSILDFVFKELNIQENPQCPTCSK